MKKSKRYKILLSQAPVQNNTYGLGDVCDFLLKSSRDYRLKFLESIDLAINLNLEKKYSISDSILLPYSYFIGERKILVFAQGEKIDEAKDAGAQYAGGKDLIKSIENGWCDFDVVISTPDMMKEIGRLGPVLGRHGMMPSIKMKTITFDIKNTVKDFKGGRLFFKVDKSGIMHFKVGNIEMDKSHLVKNVQAFYQKLLQCRPIGLKGVYVKSMYASSTMGLSYRIDHSSF